MTELYKQVNGVKVRMSDAEAAEFLAGLPSEEELAASALEKLRAERNQRLANTDWWVMPDRTATQAQLDYRQALRDITDTYTSLDDVVWPTELV
jgi:hypothetical protein